MGKRLDLTNQKFGRLTALYPVASKNNRSRWHCKCDCGTEIDVDTADLRRGHTQSCGCLQKERTSAASLLDLTGRQFGFLTVLERDFNYTGHQVKTHWICECAKCGNISSISADSLLQKHIISCGCAKSKGEYAIMMLLKDHNISFISEYKFPECKNRRYDFAILNENNEIVRLIEYDGLQHYFRPRANHWSSTSTLEETQKKDKEKNILAQQHNIPLVRIPYWELDNLTFDMLFNDKYLVKEKL